MYFIFLATARLDKDKNMRWFKYTLGLLCLLLTLTLQAQPISKIIVFGDSLSDNGNLYALTKERVPKPPYYQGRYSNGLVWPEILAKDLFSPPLKLEDYAIAGAQTRGIKPPGLNVQIKKYLKHHTVDPNALYIIWSGSDNYINHPQAGTQAINKAVNDVDQAIIQLADHGAKLFLIPNLPNIGITPLAQHWNKKYPKLQPAKHLTWLSKTHNAQLKKQLSQLTTKYPITILTIDVYHTLAQAMQYPKQFNLTNITDRCYVGTFYGGGKACKNPDEYLFWDWVHPTTRVHKLLAQEAYHKLINIPAMPTNSTLPQDGGN